MTLYPPRQWCYVPLPNIRDTVFPVLVGMRTSLPSSAFRDLVSPPIPISRTLCKLDWGVLGRLGYVNSGFEIFRVLSFRGHVWPGEVALHRLIDNLSPSKRSNILTRCTGDAIWYM